MAEQLYLLEENQETTFDVDKLDEWKALVDELGLEGQKELLSTDKEGTPIPFQYMNQGMKNMFEVLCPRNVEANEFDAMPIPLKVLGILKLAESEHYFGKIEIWYDDVKPDPVMVGYTGKKGDGKMYLLARWGDVLKTFDELLEVAKKRWLEDKKSRLESRIIEAKKDLENLEHLCHNFFRGKSVYIY